MKDLHILTGACVAKHKQPTNMSDRYRCIFIHIPKAAGTSVKHALGLPGMGHPPWYYFAREFPSQWKTYLKFTIIRNPWDRVVSAYSYARMETSYWHNPETFPHPDYALLKDMSFSKFCEILYRESDRLKHQSWRPQCFWLLGENQGREVLAVDCVLRFENLPGDFDGLCGKLGITVPALPLINTTLHAHFRNYYNKHTTKLVEKKYARDIELFGYKF